jgi:hypothetical protein
VTSPALTLARRAVLTILACRPRLDEVSALVPAVTELSAAGCTLGLVCVGDEPYSPAEVASTAGLPLLGVLPVDVRAAAVFDRDGLDSGRTFRRSRLADTASDLAELIRSRCAELVAPDGHDGAGVAASPEIPVSLAIANARARVDGPRGPTPTVAVGGPERRPASNSSPDRHRLR